MVDEFMHMNMPSGRNTPMFILYSASQKTVQHHSISFFLLSHLIPSPSRFPAVSLHCTIPE